MKNEKIRQAILKNRIKYYEVADVLGISPGTLSVWLRKEFTPEQEQEVLKAINSIVSKIQCVWFESEGQHGGNNDWLWKLFPLLDFKY